MRVLYDGLSFEVIREGETYVDGSFRTRYGTGGAQINDNRGTEGSRYRWLGEGTNGVRTRESGEGAYSESAAKWTGTKVTLYGKGEAVSISVIGSGTVYLGKDVIGSVRSTTGEYGSIEERYEYDAFGEPYRGDLTGGMNLGYTGKPYDAATDLYNYGYRDYSPSVARFTTADPVRDGNNWFAYVNNDPVNWIDPWGLARKGSTKRGVDLNLLPEDKPDDPNDNIRTYAEIVPRPQDTFVVGAHGTSSSLADENRRQIKPDDLAEMIKNHPGYEEGMSVTLYSCNTGKGENPYAQQLADAMGPGITVNAPNDYLWMYSDGSTPVIAPYKEPGNEKKGPDKKHEGEMLIFVGKAEKGD
jgi:RHS repeat-associated protein